MKKRILAMLLAFMMLVTIFPLSVFADDAVSEHDHAAHTALCPGEGEKHTKTNCEYEQLEKVEPYCANYGYTFYQCKECNVKFAADFVAPVEGESHTLGELIGAVEPTCEKPGYTGDRECTKCDYKLLGEEYGEPTGHELVESGSEGDCLSGGEIIRKCKNCDYEEKETFGETGKGHSWNGTPTEIKKAPTCNETGIAVYTCTVCGDTKEVVIYATHDHKLTKHEAVEAKCGTDGNIEYWTCDICDEYFKDADATDATTKEAVVVDGLKHDFENGEVLFDDTGKLTCSSTETGLKVVKCANCTAESKTTVSAPAHDWTDEAATTAATCTTYGYKFYFCVNCGTPDNERFKTIAPLGHLSYEESEVEDSKITVDATCETDGKRTWICGRNGCEEAMSEVLEKTGHKVATGEVKVTCITVGYKFEYCENDTCDAYDKIDVYTDDNGDSYNVTVEGNKVAFIKLVEISAIDPNAHVTAEPVVNNAPTCTKAGDGVTYCTLCDKQDIYVTLDPTGHDKNGGSVNKDPTCTENGHFYYLCTCGEEVERVDYAATGHKLVKGEPVAPTCIESGYTRYTCSVCDYYEDKDFVDFEAPETGWYDSLEDAEIAHNNLTFVQEFRKGSCTTVGLYQYKCSDCETYVLVRIGDGTGSHDYEETAAGETATCGKDGKTAELTCKKCGDVIESETIPATGKHTWEAADCTTPKTCSVCEATEGEALGHTWIDATCTAPKTCSVCKATEGEVLGHTWIDATCTAPKTCSVCKVTDGDALGHEMKIIDSADVACEVNGYIHYACDRCKSDTTLDYTYEYITGYEEAIGHDWTTNAPVVVEPDCLNGGTSTIECANKCGEFDETVLEALGHKNAAGDVLVDSCTNKAADRLCVNCKETIGQTHGDNKKTVHVDATCTDYGYELEYCDACGYQKVLSVDDDKVLAGHKWSKWSYDFEGAYEPTMTEKGKEVRECEVCGITEGRDVDPLEGLTFNMTTANAVKGNEYADSSLVAVTVTVTGNEKGVNAWGMQFNVNYDTSVLEFVEAKFVSESFKLLPIANDVADKGYVSVLVNTENDANGATNAIITEEESVVVLYFRVTIGDKDYKAQDTTFSIDTDNILIVDKDNKEIDGVGNSTEIHIKKLMDINGDGGVTLADVKQIADMITNSNEYNVTADVDKDGQITVADFMAIREYLISAKTYGDITALGATA